MEQIVLDIPSPHDARLIMELMKKFKGIEVNSFSTHLTPQQTSTRIAQGIKDADMGNVKPWKEVKSALLKRIKAK